MSSPPPIPAPSDDDLITFFQSWDQVHRSVLGAGLPQENLLQARALSRILEGQDFRFRALDTPYHDWWHMLETAKLFSLLFARYSEVESPNWSPVHFQVGLWASLLHDSGYLKERSDEEGTGAKYTSVHVRRSQEFARRFLAEHDWDANTMMRVWRIIGATDYRVPLNRIDYSDEYEWILARMVVTADFVSQFSDRRYPDKIPHLFAEFRESWDFNQTPPRERDFATDQAMMRQSQKFWEEVVLPKLEIESGNLFAYLREPYPDGPNPLARQIERNLERIRSLAG